MIHMYGIHRMRKRNVVRYSFHVLDHVLDSDHVLDHVLDSDFLPSRFAADLVVLNEGRSICFGQYLSCC